MTVQNYFCLSASERDAALTLDGGLGVTAIDNANPGAGINLNDQVPWYSPGSYLPLVGLFVVPRSVLDDPARPQSVKDYLLTNAPYCLLDEETIFAPVAA